MVNNSVNVVTGLLDFIENNRYRHYFLLIPALALVIGFMIVPLASLFRISFHESSPNLVYVPGFTFEHYIKILTDDWYLETFLRSAKMGLIVVFASGILGYAVAYNIWRSSGAKRFIILLCVLFSLFTTILIRLYGLSAFLSRTGPLNNFLMGLKLIDEPVRFSYSLFGVIIGLTNECLPFVALILISVLEGIKWTYVDAAADLGASKFRSFVEVILPLSIRGLAIASAVSFIWSIGAFATPSILGSPREWTVAMEAESQILKVYNWPLGAALVFALLIISFLIIIVYFQLTMKEKGGETR
jgi:spermidine/putrescine transport system permease protein